MGQYDRVSYEGKQLTRRQRQAIKHSSGLLVERWGLALHCYQGSWRPETDYSGTTHTRAGVGDFYVYGMSSMKWDELCAMTRVIRREGRQAAFLRGPFCDMPWHWHVLDLDTTRMDPWAASFQVPEYRRGNDGLNAGHDDPVPYRPSPIRKWDFKN
jgi:hypothetical protein